MNGSEGMIVFNPPTTINATLQSTGTGPTRDAGGDRCPIRSRRACSPTTTRARSASRRAIAISRRRRSSSGTSRPKCRCRGSRASRSPTSAIAARTCRRTCRSTSVQFGVERRDCRQPSVSAVAAGASCGSRRAQSTFDSLQVKFEKRAVARPLRADELHVRQRAGGSRRVGRGRPRHSGHAAAATSRISTRCCARIAARTRRRRVIA